MNLTRSIRNITSIKPRYLSNVQPLRNFSAISQQIPAIQKPIDRNIRVQYVSTRNLSFPTCSIDPCAEAPGHLSFYPPTPLDFEYTKKIRSVLIIKKWQSKSAAAYAQDVTKWLTDHGIQVFVEPTTVQDYDTQYPSVLDLLHQSDPHFQHNVSNCFPTLAKAYSNNNTLVNALQQQKTDSTHTTQDASDPLHTLKDASFWTGYSRDSETAFNMTKLDPRECISFARKHAAWQDLIDVVVSIGGDGTLLHVSSLFPHRVPPTLAFGCGSFGFLMPFNPDRFAITLTRLINGELRLFNRTRLAFKVTGANGLDNNSVTNVPPFSVDDPNVGNIRMSRIECVEYSVINNNLLNI